jgi:hypothetical protein
MTRSLRAIGIAILMTAMLHATAGICLCHRGPDAPASMPGSHSCCHPVDATGQVAIGGVQACCHIEAAQRDMTPGDAVQLVPPATVFVAVVADTAVGSVAARPSGPTVSSSPPIGVLRL